MTDTATETKTVLKVTTPTLWKVILHNDNYTPFDFVIALLCEVFHKSVEDATAIAAHVHSAGKAQIGLYTKEIAISKATMATQLAEEHEHPLLTTMEQA